MGGIFYLLSAYGAYRVCGAVSTETQFRIGTDKYSVTFELWNRIKVYG